MTSTVSTIHRRIVLAGVRVCQPLAAPLWNKIVVRVKPRPNRLAEACDPAVMTWSVSFDRPDKSNGVPPSRFVELKVTLQLEVVDEVALRGAAAPLVGNDPQMAEVVLAHLANCAGLLVQPKALLSELPGTEIRSSSSSAGYWDPSLE